MAHSVHNDTPHATTSMANALAQHPADAPAGDYSVSLHNGHASAALDSFVAPEAPHVTTVAVRAARAFSPRLFRPACPGGGEKQRQRSAQIGADAPPAACQP